jgi:hypothetical protein
MSFWESIVVEHRAYAMAHIEGGFVRRLLPVLFEHPPDLQGAHSFLRLANQVNDFKPDRQGIVGVLEYRANQRREAVTVFLVADDWLAVWSVGSFAAFAGPIPSAMLDLENLVVVTARAADTFGPTKADKQFHALVLGFVLFVNLSKANHEQTSHLNRPWCQVR